MHAFIECHIEQGSNLDDRQLSVAVVREITGIYREHIRIRGEADHAGTTPMNRRHDALLAASEMALSVEAAVNGLQRKDVAGTTGQLHVSPDAINIVPYAAELVMEIRTPDTTARSQIMDLIALKIKDIAFRRGVAFERKVLLDQPAIAMSPWVMDALYGALDAVAAERVTLNSLAGHDAVHVAGVVPTGMLFVRSIGGKSHCASEYTRMDDIETAGNILLQAIINLDQTERI
jgi:N-carbamoyl-L-amino-acid hydrolase